jgi:arginase
MVYTPYICHPQNHNKMVQIISSMSELGAGKRGASLGLEAIRIASFKSNAGFFKKYKVQRVPHVNNLLYKYVNNPFGKRIEGIVKMYRRLSAKVAETLEDNKFPIVISGDHSNGGATIAGIKQAFPNKRLGVIWIDAHADLHSPYTSPSGNMHGMPLATAIAEDNLDVKTNTILDETKHHWEKLKGSSQRVKPEDIVFIALRDTESPEDYIIDKYGIKVFKVDELRQKGVQNIVKASLSHLQDCDIIYVSFDVDSMDPSVSVGTGTPVANGLSELEAMNLLEGFCASPKTCCLEITEVNPLLDDKGNAMGEAAFRLLENTVSIIEENI